jgi:phosphoribosylpyrophosphate synthetase
MRIHAFSDSERLARRVAKIAQAVFGPIAVHRFPDGETLVRVSRPVDRMRIRVVDVVVAHAVFEPGAMARIRAAGARRIVSCDSIYIRPMPSKSPRCWQRL